MNWRALGLGFLLSCVLLLGACVMESDISDITLAPTPSTGYCGDDYVQHPEDCMTCPSDAGICPVETPPAMSQQLQTEQQQPVPASAPTPPPPPNN